MSYSGDHRVLYAPLTVASGDQAEAPAAAVYSCADRPRPAKWNRFILLSVAIIATVFVVVILVTMRASAPPCLPGFTVESVTVTSLSTGTASSGVRFGDFRLTLAVRNPNTKVDVRVDTLVAGVYYGDTVVAEAALPPMYQAALAERKVTALLVAAAAPHVGSGVTGGVRQDMARGGSGDVVIRFRVEATCNLAFHVGGVDAARWGKVMVRCDDVLVRLDNATAPSTSGKLVGLRRPCTVSVAAPLLSLLAVVS